MNKQLFARLSALSVAGLLATQSHAAGIADIFAAVDLTTVATSVVTIGVAVIGIAMAFKGVDLGKRGVRKV